MGYQGKHTAKFQFAQYVAASLAYLMLHQRDAVGLVLHDTQVRTVVKPRATSKHLLQILTALEQAHPGGETAPDIGTGHLGLQVVHVDAVLAEQRQDVGTYWLLTARCGDHTLRARLDPDHDVPSVGAHVWLKVTGAHTCYYGRDETLIASADLATETSA